MFLAKTCLDKKQRNNKLKIAVVLHRQSSQTGLLGQFLQRNGFSLDFYYPILGQKLPKTLKHHAGVVILGGPMSVNDKDVYINEEIDWISLSLKDNKPFLGICLGAQMLAKNLGGCVAAKSDESVEIGWYPLEGTVRGKALMSWPGMVYHLHNEGIYDLPKEAVLLATGQTYPTQAFRYGKNAWGLQFHPELTRTMIQDWLIHSAQELTKKGAQSASAHLKGYSLYGQVLCEWFDNTLQQIFGVSTTCNMGIENCTDSENYS
ncbi:Hypothetcial protein [Bartonella clarridgeiae 73]|uniref:Hypothetcial protein n=1 Tax=Bartonella clarridgeiae (strain CCUG 45776 / CIP 104772 / 73) TaxID=696125 RepID=E6YJF9_BARC7|nr:glutamine amidotransferase [Bartonella clarridgeiae]WCR55769.1 MAG: Glutamine amidotransferase class I [Bartonella clarridgeiae]CBI76997.1 Hypothetcial protein [Bartonella clarridgeiae 73]